MKMMPTCREVAETISKENAATLSPWGRLMFRVHLARCRDCTAYLEQIRTLGETARDLYGDDPSEPGSLSKLEAAILEKCGSNGDTGAGPGSGEAVS